MTYGGLQTPRTPSRRRHERMRLERYYWLRLRHNQRRARWLGRAGKIGLAEDCYDAVFRYEVMLGLPSTKGYDP